jgi:hypothetical protein
VPRAQRRQFLLEVAHHQVVFRLQRLVARQTVLGARVQRRSKTLRREVGGPDRPHLARLDQRAIGFQRLLDRRIRIVAVRLVEVDIVGAEPAQRLVGCAQDVGFAETLLARRHLRADLGGNDHVGSLAAPLQPVADDGLRFPAMMARRPFGIDVGGVDEIEARVDEAVEQPEAHLLVRRPAEHVAAEAERRDEQFRFSESALLHSRTSLLSLRP